MPSHCTPLGIWSHVPFQRRVRRARVEELLKSAGGKLEAFYFGLGETDAFAIVDAPDNGTVAAHSLAINASGAVNLKTTVLLTPEEIDQATKKTVATGHLVSRRWGDALGKRGRRLLRADRSRQPRPRMNPKTTSFRNRTPRVYCCSSLVLRFGPIVLRSTPTPSSSISTTSPGCMALVEPGVPVKSMSPDSKVTYLLT